MRFVYGTGNRAKLESMREMLGPLPVIITGLDGVAPLPDIDESGSDPLENAVIKAKAYYDALKTPVFSCDSGLFIEGLADSRQPGVHVRCRDGTSLTDEEMIDYYASLAADCGGQCTARYRNAICLIGDDTHIYKSMAEDLWGERFIISSRPHPARRPGYPLDSLSIHIESGKYYFDLHTKRAATTAPGFRRFFTRVLGELGVK